MLPIDYFGQASPLTPRGVKRRRGVPPYGGVQRGHNDHSGGGRADVSEVGSGPKIRRPGAADGAGWGIDSGGRGWPGQSGVSAAGGGTARALGAFLHLTVRGSSSSVQVQCAFSEDHLPYLARCAGGQTLVVT